MELTKQDTYVAKGVAICLMMGHHLYNFKDRLIHGNAYIPLFYFKDFEYHFSKFGRICIAAFLFLSGYGLYLSFSKSSRELVRYIFYKLIHFYKIYWTYFFIFVPIGLFFFKEVTLFGSKELRYTFDFLEFLKNFLALSSSYNSEWWFAKLYLLLLLFVFPLYFYLLEKDVRLFLLVSFFLYGISVKIEVPGDVFFYQICFAMGLLFAKYHFFSTLFFKKIDSLTSLWLLSISCVCVLIRFRIGAGIDFILAPLFLYVVLRLLALDWLRLIFDYLGRYSFPIWLNHTFFCYYYFQDLVFWPRYSPALFINLLFLSFFSAVLIEHFQAFLFGKLSLVVRFIKTSSFRP